MAEYKTIQEILRDQTTLALKYRVDRGYSCVVWRQKRSGSDTNRRFYREEGEFWYISADVALDMLAEAETRGLLSAEYFRWSDRKIEAQDTAYLNDQDMRTLLAEVLVDGLEDQDWRNCDDLRIVACVEPWEHAWRKIMIVSKDKNRVTFRSTTRSYDYNFVHQFDLSNGWMLDRAMMDADGSIHQIHLNALRDVLGNS